MVVDGARTPASRASGGHSEIETIVYSPILAPAGLIRQMPRSCRQELLTSLQNDALDRDREKTIASSMFVSKPAACRSCDLSVRCSIISQVHTFFLCHHFHCICVRLMWSSGFSLV
jgi:hypothetical protein